MEDNKSISLWDIVDELGLISVSIENIASLADSVDSNNEKEKDATLYMIRG